MVSTRQHPSDFSSPSTAKASDDTFNAVQKSVHTPSAIITLWLVVSVPLVIWDAGYVLLRPHSMPGGKFHSPIWTPYALYGTVDYIYGWPAFNARNGFTAAQTVLNLLETVGYIYYLYIVSVYGRSVSATGRGLSKKAKKGIIWLLMDEKVVPGRAGAVALLVVYSASVMTFSKTVLYWLNEYYSGFDNIGHNDLYNLVVLWIIPNGLWLVFPAYTIYVLGVEILNSLELAPPRLSTTRPKAS